MTEMQSQSLEIADARANLDQVALGRSIVPARVTLAFVTPSPRVAHFPASFAPAHVADEWHAWKACTEPETRPVWIGTTPELAETGFSPPATCRS